MSVVEFHEPSVPLFLYLALHNTHAPIEAPQRFVDLYSFANPKENNFNAQVSFVDETVKNLTLALKAKQPACGTTRSLSGPRTTAPRLPLLAAISSPERW